MMNCPHSGEGWCLDCVQRYLTENRTNVAEAIRTEADARFVAIMADAMGDPVGTDSVPGGITRDMMRDMTRQMRVPGRMVRDGVGSPRRYRRSMTMVFAIAKNLPNGDIRLRGLIEIEGCGRGSEQETVK